MFSRQKEVWVDMFSVPISCATVCVYQHPLASDIICRLPVRPTYEVHLRKRITPKSKTFFKNIPWWSFEMFQLIQLIIRQGSSENYFKSIMVNKRKWAKYLIIRWFLQMVIKGIQSNDNNECSREHNFAHLAVTINIYLITNFLISASPTRSVERKGQQFFSFKRALLLSEI